MKLSRTCTPILLLATLLIGCRTSPISVTPDISKGNNSTATITVPPTSGPVLRTAYPDVSDLEIAYILDGNIWLWSEETGSQQLNFAGNARRVLFSDDGELIAYMREFAQEETEIVHEYDEREIWVMESDGSNDRQIIGSEQLSAIPRSGDSFGMRLGKYLWVPDSHTIAYSTYEISGEIDKDSKVLNYKGSFNFSNQLVSVDDGVYSTLFEPGKGGQLSYSPDARFVAVVTPDNIRIVDADGIKEILKFPYDPNIYYWDPLQAKFYAKPVWSKSSNMLMVSIPWIPDSLNVDPEDTDEVNITEIWALPTDNSPERFIGRFEDYFTCTCSTPLISPNLTSVIYSARIGEDYELHGMNTVGANDVLIASATFIWIKDWAPDSSSFVFVVDDFSGEYKLAKVGETGYSDLADVTNVAFYTWIDENRILFTTQPDGDEPIELRVGLVDGLSVLIVEVSSNFVTINDFIIVNK